MKLRSAKTAIWAVALLTVIMADGLAVGQMNAGAAAVDTLFAPLQQWQSAIIQGDAATLRTLYSTNSSGRGRSSRGENECGE